MRLDLSGDWVYVDNLSTATLKVEGQSDVTLPECVLDEPYTLRELEPTGAAVLRHGTVFVWPRQFSSAPPIGSTVVDNEDTYWTVWKLVRKQHIEYWEPFCLNLSIVTADENTATVLRAVYGKGAANEAVAQWRGLWSGLCEAQDEDTVAARFQPSEEQARLEFGGESSREVYRVYFKDPVPIDLAGGEYRLVDSDGNRFRVMKYFQENRIDRLPVAIAERITEGREYHG